jgi:lipopolysaccharide heptosyltransferase I
MLNGVPRILIVRLSAIGDVVRVLPALHSLRRKYPNAQIDWAVEAKSADVVEGHPSVDRTLVFERPKNLFAASKSFLSFCRQIRRNRYDIVLDFHGILKTGVITWFSGAEQRFGFARPRARELSYLFTNRKALLPSPDLNRVEENLLLCDLLSPKRSPLDVTIYVPVEIQEDIDDYIESTFEGGKRIVAIHPPVERFEKQWPLAYYAELADLLLADGRFEVLLTWGPGQFKMVEEVRSQARRNPIIAPEITSLKHYAWLVHRADLYVGGDTGPMHIAAAMGTPVVAIFGGTDPRKHAPYQRTCEVLRIEDSSLSVAERLERVTPEMAYDACVRLFTV